ncbi:hypothetical protein DM860_011181 [Cuscuta australis]|uniref:cytokinin riboside 5'-monophosphate phosphoribohydrolase n=1 Tax=Cuscuta australis TaxID=267555 RepID=A0A328DF82_9ASTE|nr:hypothetical protein DM860_011181 [Cuscuta australis]
MGNISHRWVAWFWNSGSLTHGWVISPITGSHGSGIPGSLTHGWVMSTIAGLPNDGKVLPSMGRQLLEREEKLKAAFPAMVRSYLGQPMISWLAGSSLPERSAGSKDYIYHDYGKSISHSHIMEGTSRTLSYTIRFVGLLGSHSLGRNPKFMATAVDLRRELIRRRISLAYGGGNVGLQGAVASTVFTNGGLVRGFIPGYIATRRVYGPTYGVEHTVSSNYYKYFEMNHAVEAFIILPGGVDTMEGLFTLISWASEGLHNRPVGILNIDGYFNNLLKFLDDAVRQNFMASSQRKLFISSFFVDELLDKLEFAKAFPGPGVSYDEFVNPGRLDLELHL